MVNYAKLMLCRSTLPRLQCNDSELGCRIPMVSDQTYERDLSSVAQHSEIIITNHYDDNIKRKVTHLYI